MRKIHIPDPRGPIAAVLLALMRIPDLRGVIATLLIAGGVWFIYWPAALIVAGVLVLADTFTD